MHSRLTTAMIVFLFLLAGSLRAQWTPPADNKFTEPELRTYLDTQKDWLDESSGLLQGASAAKTDQAKKDAVGDIGQKYQICLDHHQISKAEFEWMFQRTAEAWSAMTYLDGSYKTTRDRLDAETREQDDAITAARKQLMIYQESKTNGWRVLSDDERAAAIKSAQQDQQTALAEVKRSANAAAAAESEAAQHEADAKSADAQAANPPPDVSADDRAEYIQNKKAEAEAARASATEARVDESDSKKSQADAQALADAAAHREAHPEIPFTDDEKNRASDENDAAILLAQNEIKAANQQKQRIAAEEATLEKTAGTMAKNVPQQNIALLRKYEDQYQRQFAEASGTTRPSR